MIPAVRFVYSASWYRLLQNSPVITVALLLFHWISTTIRNVHNEVVILPNMFPEPHYLSLPFLWVVCSTSCQWLSLQTYVAKTRSQSSSRRCWSLQASRASVCFPVSVSKRLWRCYGPIPVAISPWLWSLMASWFYVHWKLTTLLSMVSGRGKLHFQIRSWRLPNLCL